MKTIYIGDIHGNYNLLKYIHENYKEYRKIFVGDILDSVEFSFTEQINSLHLMLDMIKEGNTECIFGNHEMSYLFPRNFKCTGFSNTVFANIVPYRPLINKLFKPFIFDKENKLLITHAGLTKQIWNTYGLTVDNLEHTLNSWWNYNLSKKFDDDNEYSPFHWVGHVRGGYKPFGGPFWCDWNEEFQSIPEIVQIVGHTSTIYSNIASVSIRRKHGKDFNIDCLQKSTKVLLTENNKDFTVIDLNYKNEKS